MSSRFEGGNERRRVVVRQEPVHTEEVIVHEEVVEPYAEPAPAYEDEREETYVQENEAVEHRWWLYRISQLMWLVTGIAVILIAIRVLLRMLAANPAAPFAQFIYRTTDSLLTPFAGLVMEPAVGGVVFEFSSILAMVIYLLIGWLFVRLVWVLFDRPGSRSVTRYTRRR